ncbi:TIGR03617 family F420-dependent LLM class oxidoreductase [Mycobacterium colombiense]|uniref:Putative luciferase-like, F420-dependent oxidoreductase n=1 Tax=Mycobacterium colombiense CECT 3035 TaxID=1041522 RepID=J4JVR1_9MYCO|nr:TIGR03617 family F420-dependent LLM class oxidoreductase [Mycobacterium colombiense]EJO89477.1 putative luciferase-like, F420-dependent oxidoreductase [Mycobacterium colombiense CECT 3035]
MVHLDATLSDDLDVAAEEARHIEADGFRTVWLGESKYDPFLRCYAAATATERLRVGTAVAIAFGRSPLTVASTGYDLARYSRGRFILGLGSQVKSHIERRFSMPWSRPAARMREFVCALRAIWDTWNNDAPLDFAGDFYTHTLMPPFFRPAAHPFGPPPVYLAAVGERMTEIAGEVSDGLFFHPFNTVRYLEEITLPAVARGRERAGKTLDGFAVCGPVLTAVGRTEAELDNAIAGVRNQIAFYASTPAYRPVLELHGWVSVAEELTAMTKQGRWNELAALVDDDMLHTVAVVGDVDQVSRALVERFGPIASSISFSTPYQHDRSIWPEVARKVAEVGTHAGRSASKSSAHDQNI